jgi:hypothetical protein
LFEFLPVSLGIFNNFVLKPFFIFAMGLKHEILANLLACENQGVDMMLAVPTMLSLGPPVTMGHLEVSKDSSEDQLVLVGFYWHVTLLLWKNLALLPLRQRHFLGNLVLGLGVYLYIAII